MMNSKKQIKAKTILEDIFSIIDQSYIYRKIDQPVEKAALTYTFVYPEALNNQLFKNIIGDFIMYLFNSSHLIKIESKTQAVAEAVSILEMAYQGSSNGYQAAFIDAMNPEINGLEYVLQQIREIVISILRGRYMQWVYDTGITPLEWPIRVAIAEILLNQCKPHLPPNMQNVSPSQMADHIPVLINIVQESEDKVRSYTGSTFLRFQGERK